MAQVYIAGPVLRPDSSREIADFLRTIYGVVSEAARQENVETSLPIAERFLENANPQQFLVEIYNRINAADAVITLFAPFDPSGPVESAIAALLRKPQLIIAMRPNQVPRMMRGLPGISAVISASEIGVVRSEVARFLRR